MAPNRNTLSEEKTQNAIKKWRPRSGRGIDYDRHVDSIDDFLRANSLDPSTLYHELPTLADIKKYYPQSDDADAKAMLQHAIRQYQDENAIIFQAVKPSLLIDGPFEQTDREHIRTFTNGTLQNGRKLVLWSRTWSDDSGFDAQDDLHEKMKKAIHAWLPHQGGAV